MVRTLDRLVVNPLYLDLLSGEFRPVSDENSRAHTMARLAVATYLKGEAEVDEELTHYEYTPSWAPSVSARAITSSQSNKLTGISLAINGGYNCLDLDYSIIDSEPKLIITHRNEDDDSYFPTDEEVFPIELGSDIIPVQQRVAQYANYIFLRAHPGQL